MPRMRPCLHLFLLVLVVGGGVLLVLHWRQPLPSQSSYAAPFNALNELPDPVLLFRTLLRHKKSILTLLVGGKTTNHWSLCRLPSISFRLTLALPEDSRPDQLSDLMNRIETIEFGECRVNLHFVISQNMTSECVAFVDQLQWAHGRVYSFTAVETSLQDLVVPSWSADNDLEFNILLDERALARGEPSSPQMFENALRLLRTYFVDAKGRRLPSRVGKRVAGIGLASPEEGLDKILKTSDACLWQAPSGAALFLPWFWRGLASFFAWKRGSLTQSMFAANSGTLNRPDSWQVYLEDYMRIYGLTIIHARTPKIGSDKTGSKRRSKALLLLPLKDLPVYDADLHQVPYVELLHVRVAASQQDDYPAIPDVLPRCILDAFSDPLPVAAGPLSRKKPMYLMYEPHGSWQDQVDALQKAHVLAGQLNRTLIVPPFVNPLNASDYIDFTTLVAWEAPWVRHVSYQDFPFEHFRIPRHVLFRTRAVRYDLMLQLETPVMTARNVTAGVQVMVPALWASDEEAVEALGGCREDQILLVKNFNNVLQSLFHPVAINNLHHLRTHWNLSIPMHKILNDTMSTWPSPLACTVYSRGNGKIPCGMDIYDSKENGFEYFRNCHAGPPKLIEYAVEAGRTLNTTIRSVYVLKEASFSDVLPERGADGVQILTNADLMRALVKSPDLSLTDGIAIHVAAMLEREICQNAQLFVNNLYSPLGRTIADHRKAEGKLVRFLGQTDKTPH